MFENVNHPIKDGIIADNSTLSSRKIKEMVENATELPTPAAGDAGKVLTVNSDLKYDLEALPNEVPTPTTEDKNKVISVNNSGEYELLTPLSCAIHPGMMMNGALIAPISLGKEASDFKPWEIIIGLIDGNNPNKIIFLRLTTDGNSTTDSDIYFSGLTVISSKVYYVQIKVARSATSIPAGTTVSQIELG